LRIPPIVDPAQFLRAIIISLARQIVERIAQEVNVAALPYLFVVKTLLKRCISALRKRTGVRPSPTVVLELHCVRFNICRFRCGESILTKSPRHIFGNRCSASSSGCLATETPARSSDSDRPPLVDHAAECLVAMVGCLGDRQTRNCDCLASDWFSTVLALAIAFAWWTVM
jgi:hypothetical protein